MPTARQTLGNKGQRVVARTGSCPRCKRPRTLRELPRNFKCADIICDFCGFLAQVKASTQRDLDSVPDYLLGAAWGPLSERLKAGVYFPLYLVLVSPSGRRVSVWYLAADLQSPDMFKPRRPLGPEAKRAGWQGVSYDLRAIKSRFVRLV